MGTFLARRILQLVPVLIGVALIAFVFSELSGNPVRQMLGQHADPQTVKRVTEYYGFDQPGYVRLLRYLANLASADLGASISKDGLPVAELIFAGLSVTIKIALGGILIATVLGITLGMLAAARP